MHRVDALIVGGGPAGAACATELVRAGLDVTVLDREAFPRTKLCAGWITPEVVEDLAFDVHGYPHRFNTFEHIVVHVKGLRFRLRGPQHSIRRHEFDGFLLERSGAHVVRHTVRDIRRDEQGYVLDGQYRARWLVGAGGTRCPVYRHLFSAINPRAKALQAATLEHELPFTWQDERCHLWFFDNRLPGYSWYVPKSDGYVNLGIGAMAQQLQPDRDIKSQWRHFVSRLERLGLIRDLDLAPRGYSYFLRGNVDRVRNENAFICGDAAGLATRDLCEGIGPAVTSGQRVARSILRGEDYRLDDLDAYSAGRGWVRWLLDKAFSGRAVH